MMKIKINPSGVKGAVVVILDADNRVLLGRRPTDVACWAPGKWALPGGKVEPGETPLQAAVRETKEEMNLDVKKLKQLGFHPQASVVSYYTRSYDGDVQIDHEHTDWAWVADSEIKNYDLAPEVFEMYKWVLDNE
tara:strand:- start:263 stop:667 length:405 start_codon:yes stop_codon:yes gene_type:complete